jgi:hypothetical protein
LFGRGATVVVLPAAAAFAVSHERRTDGRLESTIRYGLGGRSRHKGHPAHLGRAGGTAIPEVREPLTLKYSCE